MLQKLTCALIMLGLLSIAKPTIAQEDAWQPTKVPVFGLQSPAIAKVYKGDEGSQVLGLIIFNPFEEALRMRQVRDPETGVARDEEYKVLVPRTNEKGEWVFERRRVELPLADAEIWSSGGQLLDSEAASKAIATPKRCFILDHRYAKSTDDPIEKFYAEVFKKDVFVIGYDPEKAKELKLPSNN